MKTVRLKLTSREKILNASRKLFVLEKISYPKISITDICNTAGVGRKTFYRNFTSKDDVYFHLIENDVHGFELIVDGIISQKKTPIEKIDLLFEQFLKTFTEDLTADIIDEIRCYWTVEAWELHSKKTSEVINKFRSVIQEGITDGSIRNDVNANLVLYIINAAAYSLRNRAISLENQLPPGMIMDDLRRIILNGIINHN